jgi:hypothetical protein
MHKSTKQEREYPKKNQAIQPSFLAYTSTSFLYLDFESSFVQSYKTCNSNKPNFMNTRIFIACMALLLALPSLAQEAKWKPIFNGKDLNGWKAVAGKATFAVKDGAIEGTAVFGTGNTFLITEDMYGDFILELELKISHSSSNSGIMARGQYDATKNEGKGLVYGYQVEADPTPRAWSGGIYDEARRGWFYPLDLNPAAKSAFKLGEWNHYRIEAIGNTLKTWVNGQEVACMDAKNAYSRSVGYWQIPRCTL